MDVELRRARGDCRMGLDAEATCGVHVPGALDSVERFHGT